MRRTLSLSAGLMVSLTACLSAEPGARPRLTALIGASPIRDVPLDATVRLELTGPVSSEGPSLPIHLRTQAGEALGFSSSFSGDRMSVALRPVGTWPPASRILILVGPGFFGEDQRPLIVPDPPLEFTTQGAADQQRLELRAPVPGTLAPINLKTIALYASPEPSSHEAALEGGSGELAVDLRAAEDLVLGALAAGEGVCAPLCPSTTYRLRLPGGFAPIAESLGEISTGTVADLRPPTLRLAAVEGLSTRTAVVLAADEPILASGTLRSAAGEVIGLSPRGVVGAAPRLYAEARLRPDTIYEVEVQAEDLSGNPGDSLRFSIQTPPAARLRITEVLTTPLHDWNDGLEGGVAFDQTVGPGPATDADEWIEVENISDQPLDLVSTPVMVRVLDQTPSEASLASIREHYFGRGGDPQHFGVGEALVLRPPGSMAQKELVIELRLGDQVLDRVEIGRSPSANHPGGRPIDLDHESLGRQTDGSLAWCLPTPGDPASPDCLRP
ncbi:MAG: hypothetical protein U1E65_24320 [Myxococcota bacterium]